MTDPSKKTGRTQAKACALLTLCLALILSLAGCGSGQSSSPDSFSKMVGQWQCESGTLEDPSDYVGYFAMYINSDGTFSMYDAEAGNPGIAGRMSILSDDQLQFSDLDKEDFDPPCSWQSMGYDQVITYKMENDDTLWLSYTDEETGSTSTLIFHRNEG